MTLYLQWFYYVLLLLICVAGLGVNILGLPGLWLIVTGALVYAWMTGFVYVGIWSLVTLVGLAGIGELIEFVAGSAGAKAAGGSKRGMMGAVGGGLVGGIVGTGVIPIPVVGTIAGAVAGSFAGAALVEYGIGQTAHHSMRVGIGAAKGRFWGIVGKTGVGLAMLLVTALVALPVHIRRSAPLPMTLPSAPPATAAS